MLVKSSASISPVATLLTGKDLTPLPFESFASVITRISWRNLLSPKAIQRLIIGKQIGTNSDSFLLPKWMSSNKLVTQFGWHAPLSDELKVLHQFRGLTHIFFSRQLKICPVCFGGGYHSYWHQLEKLSVCPIHRCLLTSRCVSCNACFGNCSYRLNDAVISLRYKCSSCGRDIAVWTRGIMYPCVAGRSSRPDTFCVHCSNPTLHWQLDDPGTAQPSPYYPPDP
ncbi:TniQ family protein [Massilia varians]|uniref:TniQ family protein n=1 Tax=Massilia varians TaxID=457921 RepID=UPI00351CE09C